MAQTTAIEWCDVSWNPTHGCSKVSPGCAHCYAETMSLRRKHTTEPWTAQNAETNVQLKPHKLREPLSGAKVWQGLGDAAKRAGKTDGKLVFVNSMSDLFHEQIPDEYIAEVFAVMGKATRHTFQVLTKRPERMRDLLSEIRFWAMVAGHFTGPDVPWGSVPFGDPIWLPNVWLGTSIENRRFVHRADLLRETPAAVRFISAEPLLGPLIGERVRCWTCSKGPDAVGPGSVEPWGPARGTGGAQCPDCKGDAWVNASLDLTDIDWLIVGGESGAGHRRIKPEWVRDLRDATRCARCNGHGNVPQPGFPRGLGFTCPVCDGNCSSTEFLFKQWGGATSKSGGRELDGRTWDEFPQVVS